jgi:hypothetical protein
LGYLYYLGENYPEAVAAYRQMLSEEEQRAGHESDRWLAEVHFMIATSFLYENKEGCEREAIREFIRAVQILLNHLGLLVP